MTKKKQVSFDAMVKFFMHNYKIPTKRDIDQLNARLDRLEKLIRRLPAQPRVTKGRNSDASPKNATQTVLEIIGSSNNGISISEVRELTGYNDKKLRNIIFYLNKMGKITRVSRGTYKAV